MTTRIQGGRREGGTLRLLNPYHDPCHATTSWKPYLRKLRTSVMMMPPNTLRQIALYSTVSSSTGNNTLDKNSTTATLYRQFQELSIEIRNHDALYYNTNTNANHNNNNNNTPISDDEFDALVRREEEWEQQYPQFLQQWRIDSGLGPAATRSGRVGSTATTTTTTNNNDSTNHNTESRSTTSSIRRNERQKRKHLSPMLSLDNVYNNEEFYSWFGRVVKATNKSVGMNTDNEKEESNPKKKKKNTASNSHSNCCNTISIITEPKLDGVSLSLRYETTVTTTAITERITTTNFPNNRNTVADDENNKNRSVLKLKWASTRGDGTIGQDVTWAAKQIPGIPQEIYLPARVSSSSSALLSSSARSSLSQDTTTLVVEVRGEVVFPRSDFARLQSEREAKKEQKNTVVVDAAVDNTSSDKKNTSSRVFSSSNTRTTVASFSNARNAASGILLRKEELSMQTTNSKQKDIENEKRLQANELRSLLRFYAYDISGLLPLLNDGKNNNKHDHNNSDNSNTIMTDNSNNNNNNNNLNNNLKKRKLDIIDKAIDAIARNPIKQEYDDEDEDDNADDRNITTSTMTKIIDAEREKNKMMIEIDGKRIREQLIEWGFPVALPVTITEIKWDNNNKEIIDDEMQLQDSFRGQTIMEQIQPVIGYYAALEEHRMGLLQKETELSNNETAKRQEKTKERHHSSKSKVYHDWGDFDVDGCVHKISQAPVKAAMGYSMKSPKWATAHKFPAQTAVSRLLDIIIQVGRTGSLTPVAILEPVVVGGVTIQRATLHNFAHLKEIFGGVVTNDDDDGNIDKIRKNELVLIRRAGDVIPQVIRKVRSNSSGALSLDDTSGSSSLITDIGTADEWISLEPPKNCPACGSSVSYDTSIFSSSSVGQVARCIGPPLLCPPRAVTSLTHAFSRDAIDLTGLSEARIQQLMDTGIIRYPNDIFDLGDFEWENIATLPGWGEKSCSNLRGSIQKITLKGISLGRFIYSLSIRHVGKHSSDLIALSYGTVEIFLDALDSAAVHGEEKEKPIQHQSSPFPQLENVLGIGPVMIDSLLDFSKSTELVSSAKDLARSLNVLEQNRVIQIDGTSTKKMSSSSVTTTGGDGNGSTSNQPWAGFRVVFTGSLGKLNRSDAQNIAKTFLGAKSTPGSVSKSTDLVVYGEKGGKKLKQAREYCIPTITAEEFLLLARENGFTDNS